MSLPRLSGKWQLILLIVPIALFARHSNSWHVITRQHAKVRNQCILRKLVNDDPCVNLLLVVVCNTGLCRPSPNEHGLEWAT